MQIRAGMAPDSPGKLGPRDRFYHWNLPGSNQLGQLDSRRSREWVESTVSWVGRGLDSLKRLMGQSYLGKWTIVGGLIGVGSGLGATAFYYGIHLVTILLLGGITGFVPPSP